MPTVKFKKYQSETTSTNLNHFAGQREQRLYCILTTGLKCVLGIKWFKKGFVRSLGRRDNRRVLETKLREVAFPILGESQTDEFLACFEVWQKAPDALMDALLTYHEI